MTLECRESCGACCIAPSITAPIPGMPNGKPAGVRCIHLSPDNACELFNRPDRPEFCVKLKPNIEMCGSDRTHALTYLADLEQSTAADRKQPTDR